LEGTSVGHLVQQFAKTYQETTH